MEDDGGCRVTALNKVFGSTDIADDLSQDEFATDAGILSKVFPERGGRPRSTFPASYPFLRLAARLRWVLVLPSFNGRSRIDRYSASRMPL